MTALVIKRRFKKLNDFRKAFNIVLIVLFYVQVWASNVPGFIEGAQLYVVANSGLILRVSPNIHSEALAKVEFGSVVEVLNQPDTIQYLEKLDWVEGKWIYVEYDGVTGFMFDGYLSDLPLPIYEFERCQLDLDFMYPLESWTEVNLVERDSDTIVAGVLKKVTDRFVGGEKRITSIKNNEYKLELYLNDIRLMDAYHLLQCMIDTKARLATFKDQSTFIEDREGQLYKVKIKLDNPVEIRKLKSGDVKITIRSDNYMCNL